MSTQIPPVSTLEMRTAPAARDFTVEPTEAPRPALEPVHNLAEASPVEHSKLLVRFDGEAGRFVQTMTDSDSKETIWTYPREAQLSYSRAVMAYLRALSRR